MALALAPLVLAGGVYLAAAWAGPGPPPARADRSLLVVLAAAAGIAILRAWSLPAFHYDGLLYHLPTAALLWQEKALFTATSHPQIGANPVLSELPKIWAYAFSGDDSLATLQPLPYALGLAALAYSLARRFGAARAFALFAALATLLVPKLADQELSANVDLLAGFWGAVAADLLARRKNVPAAAALLVFAQLKYTTLLPAAAGALLLFARRLRVRPMPALAWAAAFASFGGFTEWRNLAKYGNPVAPYQLLADGPAARLLARFAPHAVVKPAERDPAKWPGYYWNGIEEAAGPAAGLSAPSRHFAAWGDAAFVPYDASGGRWGPAWFVVAVPALVLAAALEARRAIRRRRASPLLVSLGIALVGYALTVKSWETRFGFLLLPFGFAAAARLLTLSWPSRRRAAPALALSALLAWCAWQIGQSHPRPALRANPGLGALDLATRHPGARAVGELAGKIDALAPRSLWIDFTYGERHEYGFPFTLLYPYFSRRWDRAVTISSAAIPALPDRFREAPPAAVLLQPGSRIPEPALAALGYRLYWNNEAGRLYAQP